MLKWKKNIKRYCFAGFLLLFFALALQVNLAAAETDSGIAEMEMDFQAEAKSETAEEILPHGEDFDLEARSGLRTFFATLGGTIQENYTMIMDSFHEKYAEFVQFLFDEYIFALIPQVPQKEYKIDVVGENLLLLKSSIGSGDSLGSLLNGWISFSTILNLVEESKSVYSLTALKAGRPCSFLIDLDDNSLQKFEYEFDDTHKVIIQKTEDGHKVAFEEIIYDYELKFIEGTVTSNFYNAVIDLGENAVFAIRLADVFTFDIDFAREIKDNAVVSPFDDKLSAPKFDNRFFVRIIIEHAGDKNGAGARAAGKGFAGAALPNTHAHFLPAEHFDKFRIDPFGKEFMIFKKRSESRQIKACDIMHGDNEMRIAHGNAGAFYAGAVDKDFLIDKGFAVCFHGDVGRFDDRSAHIHGDACDLVVFKGQLKGADTAFCFKGDVCFAGMSVFIKKFAYAAGGVAAHVSLGTVVIEHSHSEIGFF